MPAALQAWQCHCPTPASLQQFGAQMASVLQPGCVVGLRGPLGAGKTTWVQGLARGLQVQALEHVTSPTYSLVHEYPAANCTLIHMDFYRLTTPTAQALGLDEYFWRPAVIVVVEWAELVATLLPPHTGWITFDSTTRCCHVQGLQQPSVMHSA